jgi:hypothetical protein
MAGGLGAGAEQECKLGVCFRSRWVPSVHLPQADGHSQKRPSGGESHGIAEASRVQGGGWAQEKRF